MTHSLHHPFRGKVIIIGFGSIARATLPLLFKHLMIDVSQIIVITPERVSLPYGAGRIYPLALTPGNYRQILTRLVSPGDFILNLSVGVSSHDIIQFAQAHGALYLDTGIEPWGEACRDTGLSPAQRSNYALREQILPLKGAARPTAIVTHGANPGIASHFAKQALLDIAAGSPAAPLHPMRQTDWGELARALGVKTIHISEHDTQTAACTYRMNEFVNTWSVDGFLAEACQPAELGWGTHERCLPGDGESHTEGCQAAIFLNRPGASVLVRSWNPVCGPFHGLMITHGESISLADYFTLTDHSSIVYRPTVHYAYRPCSAALVSLFDTAGRNWETPEHKHILQEEIVSGVDALGVLIGGCAHQSYWYGSLLSITTARQLAPGNNASSLPVAAGIMSGMVWALQNPGRGVVEPEEMDHPRILELVSPYLGQQLGMYTGWNPLTARSGLFKESLDLNDPWQFHNVRVD